MSPHPNGHRSGFTLIELAIVLGVVAMISGGLWHILSASNTQMRDQATASQQTQLINAVNSYLQTQEGLQYMAQLAANGHKNMPLPSTATNGGGTSGCLTDANMTGTPTHAGLCGLLPPGFFAGTTNPYGQTFAVYLLKDASAAGTAPQSFSFLILTSGGDTIADTSGGRISSSIGGDGGFVYSSDVCTSGNTFLQTACGAYGAWTATISQYTGVAAATAGHVASRTFYAPSTQSSGDYWLARKQIPSDATFAYNTMQTPFYLGNQSFYFSTSAAGTATNSLFMQGGTINMGDRSILSGSGTSLATNPLINLSGIMNGATNALVRLSSNCFQTSYNDPNCSPVMSINGDMAISNLLTVASLYAQTFIYNTSDERLKTNIKELENPLGSVQKLRPVSFNFKANGKPSLGVIAQDLEKVYPQLVQEGGDGMKAVNYEGLIAPLIGAVQELKRENDDLRAQLREQKTRQETTEKEIEKLRVQKP